MRALSLAEAQAIARSPHEAREPGEFLCFAMIPIEERIGEWRYAGAARTLGGAFEALEAFHLALGAGDGGVNASILASGVVEVTASTEGAWSSPPLPSPHEVALFALGQAPHDDVGLCIVRVPSIAATPFANAAPETERPESWSAEAHDEEE